jgi:hypothetical protein
VEIILKIPCKAPSSDILFPALSCPAGIPVAISDKDHFGTDSSTLNDVVDDLYKHEELYPFSDYRSLPRVGS